MERSWYIYRKDGKTGQSEKLAREQAREFLNEENHVLQRRASHDGSNSARPSPSGLYKCAGSFTKSRAPDTICTAWGR